MKHSFIIALAVFTGFAFKADAAIINPSLQEKLENLRFDSTYKTELLPVLIIMDDQADFYSLYEQVQNLSRFTRREETIEVLKSIADNSQTELIDFLLEHERIGQVRSIERLWIINAIAAYIVPSLIDEIAQISGINRIHLDEERYVLPVEVKAAPAPPTDDLTWSVLMVNGPAVWRQGYLGQNVIVAVIDVGVNYFHQDLMNNMWDGSPQFPLHGWDFYNNDNDPYDDGFLGGHGSHCAGIVAGDGTSGINTGIAPQARIMAIKTLSMFGTGTESQTMQGMQFALEHGADIISMSLRWVIDQRPDKAAWRTLSDNLLAAGMNHANAAGNEGQEAGLAAYPVPNNIGTPSCIPPPWRHPDQFQPGDPSGVVTVGSTDQIDSLSHFSSQGPCTWEEIEPWNDYWYQGGSLQGYVAPDIVAPGEDITSCTNLSNNGYLHMSGTSMAAPQIAGIMALMLSKDPTLTPEQIDEILESTAVDKGIPGKDNQYGSGRVDALAAVNAVESVPPLNMEVTLTPVVTPVQVPANGGLIEFNITVTNNETSNVSCAVWTMITLPDGSEYGPMINVSKTFQPASTESRNLLQSVPANAPAGIYTYDAYVGYYSTIIWDEAHFEFEKLAAEDGCKIVIGWDNSGFNAEENLIEPIFQVPNKFTICSTYPNPFNPATTINLQLPTSGQVNLSIFDFGGRKIATLIDGFRNGGIHRVTFDATGLPSGVYLYRLETELTIDSGKLVLLK